MRRDFTINSLFYNIQTGEIEDWTRLGLSDLKEKILRTPLDSKKTFEDDPLRVVRAVRFLGKLSGFRAHGELQEAASDPDVHDALRTKVTKDRIRQELIKVFEEPDVATVIRLLDQWKVNPALFECDLKVQSSATRIEHPFLSASESHVSSLPHFLQDYSAGTILAVGEAQLVFRSALANFQDSKPL